MNNHISPAIIMRIKEFGESDLLVGYFTPDKGRLKGVAKGARRSRVRFVNCLDLFCLANLEYELKARKDLHFLHSGKLINAFPGIRSDFSSLSLASYMVELTEILFPPAVVAGEAFALMKNAFFALNDNDRIDILRLHFEARAMTLGGYGIDCKKCCSCQREYTGKGRAVFRATRGSIACLACEPETQRSPGLAPETVEALKIMQSRPWSDVRDLPLTGEIISEIRPVHRLHLEHQLGRRLKTSEYLE